MCDVISGVPLEKGDILLERSNGSFTHGLIAFGQKVGNLRNLFSLSASKATTVHAAIYVGAGRVSQSHGEGLTTDPLNGHERWKVYRYNKMAHIADAAADIAQNQVIRSRNDEGFGAYNKGLNRGAVGSALKAKREDVFSANDVSNYLTNLYSANQEARMKTRTFFCSNFTVLCYSLASEMFGQTPHYAINLDYERASPSEMARYFESAEGQVAGWTRVGEITG